MEGIDETLTVALDEFLGDVSGYASNKEIYDELTDENYGLEAIKYAVDNIELDTSDLSKQGHDTTVTLTSVDEKIDGFYNTFDADIASQLQEIIGDSTTGLTGTTQTEEQVSTLRTLQESISDLASAMNTLVDSHVINNTAIDGYTFESSFQPSSIGDIYANCNRVQFINDDKITTVKVDSFFAGNTVLREISFPLLTTLSNFSFQNCSALTKVNMPLLKTLSHGSFYGCSSLVSISLPSCK